MERMAMLAAAPADESPRAASLRILRLALYWAVFAFLVGLTGYGFWANPKLLATVWTPAGSTRFLIFMAVYAAFAAVIYFIAPRRLHVILAVLISVISCGAVGVGGPAATALFFLSSTVLGRALLWRGASAADAKPVDMILAMLLGSAIYMTVVNWTAMLPVHYPAVHALVLALPFVIWPAVLRDCLRFVGNVFKPMERTGLWGYIGFALAGFIPLAHVIDAILLPQVNNDAVVVHLAVPSIIAFNHFWPFDVHRYVFAVIPMGVSWMLLPSYLLGGEFAARLVSFGFYLATGFLFFLIARRYLTAGTAWLLTALYASTPFFLTENGNIFPENLWVALLFGAAISILRFRETRQDRYFVLAAALAASSLAVKVMGLFGILVFLAFVLRECLRRPIRFVWAIGIFALMGTFPYVWAFIKTGNPVFPFMNHIFKSPYFVAEAFKGLNRPIPSSFYELTFHTERFVDGGGTNGALGFHYMVLLPLGVLALGRRYSYFGFLSLLSGAALLVSVFLFAEVNLRYLYPALPFVMVTVAIAYAQARLLSNALYASLCAFAVAATLVNAYAMPLSAWAHREFSLPLVLGRIGIDDYRDWAAPERRLIDYLNLTRGHAVRAAIFARPMMVDLKGEAVFGNWYDYLFTTQKLAKAKTAEEVLALMREERITKFLAFKPGPGIVNLSAAVDAFLEKYTEREFAAGDVYLARFKEEWRFSEEVIKNGNFADGLSQWVNGDASVYNAASHSVSVTNANGVIQRFPVDDRLVYRYALAARCAKPDTHVRMWVNWYDAKQRVIDASVHGYKCDETTKTIAEELAPLPGTHFAEVIVAGHEADKAVEISNVSWKW